MHIFGSSESNVCATSGTNTGELWLKIASWVHSHCQVQGCPGSFLNETAEGDLSLLSVSSGPDLL